MRKLSPYQIKDTAMLLAMRSRLHADSTSRFAFDLAYKVLEQVDQIIVGDMDYELDLKLAERGTTSADCQVTEISMNLQRIPELHDGKRTTVWPGRRVDIRPSFMIGHGGIICNFQVSMSTKEHYWSGEAYQDRGGDVILNRFDEVEPPSEEPDLPR